MNPGESLIVTVVTEYFDLGPFQKGSEKHLIYTPEKYKHWMEIFAFIKNPVIAYFSEPHHAERFKTIRSRFGVHLTKVVMVNRTNLWAFSLLPKIGNIYSQPDYPKYLPNTVVPEYACAMHAKYELVYKVAKSNPFFTKYLAWLDIGTYRDMQSANESISRFRVDLPPNFIDSKVAYCQVYKEERLTIKEIFLGNHVLMGGAFFLGKPNALAEIANRYQNAVEHFLSQGLMNTDQQVLYAMRQLDSRIPDLMQLYNDRPGHYFALADMCRKAV